MSSSSSDEEVEPKRESETVKEEDDSEEEEEPPTKRRQSPARRRGRVRYEEPETEESEEQESEEEAVKSENNEEEEDSEDEDSSSSSEPEPKRAKKSSPSELICPHCDKVFSIKSGLKYHVDNFVCRPTLRPGGPVKRGRRKASDETTKLKKRSRSKDVEETDADEDYDSEEEEKGQRKRKTKKPKVPTPRTSIPESERTCPYCDKVFTVKDGMQYHVDNFVCRPTLRPGGPIQKGRRKISEGTKKQWKRVRGPLAERTCPTCKRVFTSINGLRYHREKLVCEGRKKKASTPFDTLEAGSKYVTRYGVVEVVKDDRALPAASLPKDFKIKIRNWNSTKHKRDLQLQKQKIIFAVDQLARRLRLRKYYENGNVNQKTVFQAYFGGDPRYVPASEQIVLPTPFGPDPSTPADSYPDRMVECVLVSDERERFLGQDEKLGKPEAPSAESKTRLFLQRKLLVEKYNNDVELFFCIECGQAFSSKAGYKYHMQSNVCVEKAKRAKDGKKTLQHQIERRAERRIEQRRTSTTKNQTRKKKKDFAVYPQVWLSLGFKLVADRPAPERISAFKTARGSHSAENGSDVATESTPPASLKPAPKQTTESLKPAPVPTESLKPAPVPAESLKTAPIEATQEIEPAAADKLEEATPTAVEEKKPAKPKKPAKVDAEVVSPDDVLAQLKAELRAQQFRSTVPIYPGVFKSLKFKTPQLVKRKKKQKKRPVKRQKKTKKEELKREESASKEPVQKIVVEEMEEVPLPNLAIVDIRVLAAEADAGRYPSMKRNKDGASHDSNCAICRKEEKLVPCSFCSKAVHLKCIRKKIIVKDPEPEDDFLCHSCIQYMMARRARAEKRRLKKLADKGQIHTTDQAAAEANLQLTQDLVEGREYECVAAQARQVNDIAELLRDARTRLSQNLEAVKTNSLRRRLIRKSELLRGHHS